MENSNDVLAVEQILQSDFGITGKAHALPGERDRNFRIDIDGKPCWVLKIMHAGCPLALVDLQCALLAHLDSTAALPVPRVKPSTDGQSMTPISWRGERRQAWLIEYLMGDTMAHQAPLDSAGLEALGALLAQLDVALADFDHVALDRSLSWNLTAAADHLSDVHHAEPSLRKTLRDVLTHHRDVVAPRLAQRPHQAVHNDANDHNVLISRRNAKNAVCGLIDFGDTARQPVVCEIAIACAYAAMEQIDPIEACCALVRGYCAYAPLETADVDVLLALIKTRLAVSLCVSSRRLAAGDSDAYASVSHHAAATLLARLVEFDESVVQVRLRLSAGLPAHDLHQQVQQYLDTASITPAIAVESAPVLDLGVGSLLLGANPAEAEIDALSGHINSVMQEANTTMSLGRYMEPRLLYQSPSFGADEHPCEDRRTVHLGLDVFGPAGTPVRAPLPAIVHRVTRIDAPLDYGPLVILRHDLPQGGCFYSLYGHLEAASTAQLAEGQVVRAGEVFVRIGAPPENGGWPPHLHVQLMIDDLGLAEHFPGVCRVDEASAFGVLCPNPARLLGRDDADVLDARNADRDVLARRQRLLSGALSLAYSRPLHIVRGFGAYLYDAQARAYLDVYNNVAHVGHSHPQVVDAVRRQVGLLNTNTRYLHGQILDYAERLAAKLPDPLDVCFFVNSASEANELALRLARQHTGRRDIVVAADAYHGHTSALIDMSPYKYNGPGGAGPSNWVHEVPVADDYRGPYRRGEKDIGPRYASHVTDLFESLDDQHACAGFIAETLPSVGGQIILPEGYLAAVYAAVRAHGGLCIADEVQTGFGRLGDAFWGFSAQNVVPDVVVLGKPIANGFPMGAVVTTRAIAETFETGMEFFATFGGNPVACAAANAVLDVVEQSDLAANAQTVGAHFLSCLQDLGERHDLIGDVRGMGFFLGVELVSDRKTLEPAAQATSFVVNRLRELGVLAGIDGPLHNVIKLRPTMVTTQADIDWVVARMDRALEQAGRLFSP